MNAALDLSLADGFPQPAGPDAELRAAWARWLAARNELEALPDDIPDEAEAPV